MHRLHPFLGMVSIAIVSASCAIAAPEKDDVPVAPIAPSEYKGWETAFRLSNHILEVVVVPDVGRIMALRYNGSGNLFRSDPSLEGSVATEAPDYWFNFGGDWLWPVAQNRWPDFQDSDWPPSRLLDGRPWQGRAWKGADGSQFCLVSQAYEAPLSMKVSRLIKLHPTEAVVEIKQTLEQVERSGVPVTLWNISQVDKAERVVLPVDNPPSEEPDLNVLMFDPPGEEHLTACDGAVVYDAAFGGEHKLGSHSERAWIAAQRGDVLIIERASGATRGGTFPDGGCTVEMYSNTGLGYAEIETLSEERVLAAGETLENTLTIQCYKVLPLESNNLLADHVRVILGEKEAGSAPLVAIDESEAIVAEPPAEL